MTAVFDAYAAYYDVLYANKDYEGEAKYVVDLIREFKPNARSVLELGCGTGGHAEHFVKQHFDVFGIDRSATMLRSAHARAEKLPIALRNKLVFHEGDVRSFRTTRTFDVVLSLFHVVSYQTKAEDLEKAFATAAEHLEPGGIFVFDYWFGPAVLAQKPEVRLKKMQNELFYIERTAHPVHHEKEKYIEVNFEVKVNALNQALSEVIRERHDMRYFFLPEIEKTASRWFAVKKHYGWMKRATPDVEDWAAVTVLERI